MGLPGEEGCEMTLWWVIVSAAGLFVVLLLVLRAMPARGGEQGDAGQAPVHNPIHDHDLAGFPHWHLHQGQSHDGGAGDVGGQSGSSGSGAGRGGA